MSRPFRAWNVFGHRTQGVALGWYGSPLWGCGRRRRMSEWRETTLGDFVALQRGHDLTEPQRRIGRVPVMGSAGQNGFHDTALAKGPGIVIGRSGASFGQVHFSKEDFWPHNTGLYVTDFKGNDPLFAFYFLKALDFDRFNSGSAQPSLNRNFIYPIPIRVPKPAEQKAIAAVLGALDDKIELNRRMNATLEAMARALFQSWFVDFDPVRAKLDGRPPAALDPATAVLFPDSFQDSALEHIPKGWEVKTADEVSTVGIGKTPPRMEQHWFSENPADVPWMSIRDLGIAGVFISHTAEFLTTEAVEKFRVKRIPDNTVVLSFKLTMGRVAITDGEMLSNEAIAHFRLNPDTTFGSAYLYCYLKGFGYDQLGSTSSIATAINSDMVRGMRVLVPPKGIAEAFERTVKPLFTQMKNIQKQSRTLATLRDTLLPKLLS
ncbi:MAG: restriction endonuclease subunit S, partial [Verrucomicrobiota bacterium]